ncbi:MAG: helix-turn-helix domain-containing protein, partial [Bacteroidales bacterium]
MIKLQKYTITIGSIFIFFLMLFLILVLKQKHSLNQNYRLLYEKQQELLRLANGKLIEPGIDRSNKNNKDSVESLGVDSEDQKTKERRKQLAIGITEIIENADLVYNADFNLDMLAKKLNTNTHYISEAIHECFGKNFTTLVNEVRIKRACIYMNMPEYQKYTLDFIAHKVGFKSRATFNPAFKKYTGIIPSQYLKLSKKRS